MNNHIIPLRRLSEFAWKTVELDARSIARPNPQVLADMSEAVSNYQTQGFCFFRPYGEQEHALHSAIASSIDQCDELWMQPTSKAENYRSSTDLSDPVFLDEFNQYMSFSDLSEQALGCISDFLQYHHALLVAMLGYSFSVLNVRCQISKPGATVPPFDWHKDELPESIVKILYYLDGASEQAGATAIRLDSGGETVFEGEIGSWALININRVLHKGIPSINQRRKMLEITLGPALISDCTAHAVALNASYPWVPWLSPSFRLQNSALANHADFQTAHFNSLVTELDKKNTTGADSASYASTLEILEYNACHPPKYLNIGGGPGFLHKQWRNFEAVFSANNPVPFQLCPGIHFPLQDNSIEAVYSSHNLEHLDDATVAYVLTEAFRVLQHGGVLVIKIPDFDEYLTQWRNGDSRLTFEQSPFSFKESQTWKNRGIADTITYRTAEMFCGVWDTLFGDENALFSDAGDWNGPGYVGAPWIAEQEIAEVFTQCHSCHEIAAYLKNRALALGEKVYLNHQNAWSREEMSALLTEIGFQIISLDSQFVVDNTQYIPGIGQWYAASAYYLAKKPE